MEQFDVIVLGCGISGLVCARQLAAEGRSVVILDDYRDPGGNHQSVLADGLEFDIGAIFFHEDESHFRVFPELLAATRPGRVAQARINPRSQLTRFGLDIGRDIAPAHLPRLAVSAAEAAWRRNLGPAPRSADAYARMLVGSWLYRHVGLDGYLARLFGEDPRTIDARLGEQRLQWLRRRTSPWQQAKRLLGGAGPQARAGGRVHRPGGFAAYYREATQACAARGVRVVLGAGLRRIARASDRVVVESEGGTFSAGRVISTVPLPIASALAGLDPPALAHVRLLSLHLALDGRMKTGATVIYNFSRSRWKRATVHSAFYGAPPGRHALTVEVPVPPGMTVPAAAELLAEFAAQATLAGALSGDLRLVGETLLDHAYPVLSIGYGAHRDAALSALAAAGVDSIGRQGGFHYYPTAAVSANEAMRYLAASATRLPAS